MHTNFDIYRNRTIAVGLFLVCAQAVSAQIGLGLSPMRVDIKMQPGMDHSGVLTLDSDSRDRVRVRAEALDFLIDQNETPQFETRMPSESAFSCREWVSINPVETEVGPGRQVTVRYTLRMPATAESPRGYHCAIGFTTLPTASQVPATGIRTAVQAISAFYIVAGSPGIEGEFKELRLLRTNDGLKARWTGEVVIRNHSLTHFRPVGELSLINQDGNAVESVPLTSFPALPQREQRYSVVFTRDFPPGSYTLRARVDFGTNVVEEGTAVVSVDP